MYILKKKYSYLKFIFYLYEILLILAILSNKNMINYKINNLKI
jgi:hypothetical protein